MTKIKRVLKDYHKIDISDIRAEIRAISQTEMSATKELAQDARTWAMVSGIVNNVLSLPEMSFYLWSCYDRARATNLANSNDFDIRVNTAFDRSNDRTPLLQNVKKTIKTRLTSMRKRLFPHVTRRRFMGFGGLKRVSVMKSSFMSRMRQFNRRQILKTR